MNREKQRTSTKPKNAFLLLNSKEAGRAKHDHAHVFGNKIRCETDIKAHPTPKNKSPLSLVVDSSEGFIPLWQKDTTLRWRFQEQTLANFSDPLAAKAEIRELLGKGLLAWGGAAPIKFAEKEDLWDFEISIRNADDCDTNGCVLASAFFPDSGRHELIIYPEMFQQPKKEQVETLAHELGHVFGLRHFFAQISEKEWKSEIFGKHAPFSIMNYGAKSELTKNDRADLKKLYQLVWSGKLTEINGTAIRLVRPFHTV